METLGDKLTLRRMAELVKAMCDRAPENVFSTNDVVISHTGYHPKQEMFNALAALGKIENFPYVTKSGPIEKIVWGRLNEVRHNLWRCPASGPCEIPVLSKSRPDISCEEDRIRLLEHEVAQGREYAAQLEQRIAQIEGLLGF